MPTANTRQKEVSFYTLKISRKLLRKGKPMPCTCPKDIVSYVRHYCLSPTDAFVEHAWLVFLDERNLISGHYHLSQGGTKSTVVDIRLACTAALSFGTGNVIIVHNHTSGSAMPSHADIDLTHKLKVALSTLDIKLIDHVIIADDQFFSFNDEVVTDCRPGRSS